MTILLNRVLKLSMQSTTLVLMACLTACVSAPVQPNPTTSSWVPLPGSADGENSVSYIDKAAMDMPAASQAKGPFKFWTLSDYKNTRAGKDFSYRSLKNQWEIDCNAQSVHSLYFIAYKASMGTGDIVKTALTNPAVALPPVVSQVLLGTVCRDIAPVKNSATWAPVGRTINAQGVVYIERSAIGEHSGVIKIWELADYNVLQKSSQGNYQSMMVQTSVDCTGKTLLVDYVAIYSGQMGQGAVVWSGASEKTEAKPVSPDSVGQAILKGVCTNKPPQAHVPPNQEPTSPPINL